MAHRGGCATLCHAVPSHLNRSAIMTAPLLLYKPTMQCFLFKRKWSVNSMNRPHHVSPILGKDRSECSRVKCARSTFLEKEWLERTVQTVEKERGPFVSCHRREIPGETGRRCHRRIKPLRCTGGRRRGGGGETAVSSLFNVDDDKRTSGPGLCKKKRKKKNASADQRHLEENQKQTKKQEFWKSPDSDFFF